MENIIIVVHVLVALAIIGLILLQQGKGAEAGASFGGGASQTVFGSQGGGSFFAKLTGVLAFTFFVTSFSLAIIAKNKADITAIDPDIPVLEQVAPEASDIPVLPGAATDSGASDIPAITPELAPAPAENQQ